MDLDLIQASVTAVEKNGGKTNLIISSHDVRDAYAALVIADKRFVNTMSLDGGWKALEYNGIPWLADADCPPNTVFFVDTSHLEIMQMSGWDWIESYKFCPIEILLNAGTSDGYNNPNYGTVYYCRLSAGKIVGLAWWDNGWGRFVFNRSQENEQETIFLSRYFNSQYRPNSYRQMCRDNKTDLWFSSLSQNAWDSEQRVQDSPYLENKNFRVQPLFKISTEDNSLSCGEKRTSGVSSKVCSNSGSKSHNRERANETGAKSLTKSSETICKTVQDTEDIVRSVWRHTELGRNAQALVIN